MLAAGGFPNDVTRRARAVPQDPHRPRALDAGPEGDHGSTASPGPEPSASPLRHRRRVPGRLVPGLAGALPQRHAPARSRTSWTGPSPAASACCGTGGGSSTRPTATTTTSTGCSPRPRRRAGRGLADRRRRASSASSRSAWPSRCPCRFSRTCARGYLKKGNTIAELARCLRHQPGRPRPDRGGHSTRTPAGCGSRLRPRRQRVQPLRRGPEKHSEPVARPLDKGPFYAVRIVPGSFGTFAGLAADARARVLDRVRPSPSPASTSSATTRPPSWAGTTRPAASTSARR